MLDEKTIDRVKKLQALVERGTGGEQKNAERKLQQLLKKNGICSLDELFEDEEKIEYFLFGYKGKHEKTLLCQCIYKVLGASNEVIYYKTKGTRNKLGIHCTLSQKIEIDLEFEFYRNVFYEELEVFIEAFIQAQNIFPADAPKIEKTLTEFDEDDIRCLEMASNIKKKTRVPLLED